MREASLRSLIRAVSGLCALSPTPCVNHRATGMAVRLPLRLGAPRDCGGASCLLIVRSGEELSTFGRKIWAVRADLANLRGKLRDLSGSPAEVEAGFDEVIPVKL